MRRHKYFVHNILDLEAAEQYLSFAITLVIYIHSNSFTVNQALTVETNILFRQIFEDRIWVVDTRDNLKDRDNLLPGILLLA